MSAPTPSRLDANQVLQGSFDESNGRLRVETAATIVNGAVEVAIDASTDNIQIRDPNSGNNLVINPDGSINVDITGSVVSSEVTISQGGNDAIVTSDGALTVTGTSTVSGTVTTQEAGLNNFETSQYEINTTAIQITPSALPNRTSISLRVTATPNNAIFIGNNSSLTTMNGYPLYNGDTLQMDLTDANQIYAISDNVGQILYILEIA